MQFVTVALLSMALRIPPPAPESLSQKVQAITIASAPLFNIPPPALEFAVLLLNKQFTAVRLPEQLQIPPPPRSASLSINVQLLIWGLLCSLNIPPPQPNSTEFPLNVQLFTTV